MSGSAFSSSAFAAYADAIRQRESTNDYTKVNSYGYMGAYQMGREALTDAGFQDKDGNWTTLAVSLGVKSDATFLSTPSAQDVAFQNFTQKNFNYLYNFQSYIGKTVGGVLITESGLLAGAQLTGQASVKEYLRLDGKEIAHDANNVPVTQYMADYSAYNFTFPSDSKGFSPAMDIAPSGAKSDDHNGNSPSTTAGAQLPDGKSPVEKARYYADQARANAAKNLGLSNMQMYDVAMNMAASMPSFAPVPGRGARPAKFAPRRPGAGDAATLTDMSCGMDTSDTLAARPEGGRDQGVTGFRPENATVRGRSFYRALALIFPEFPSRPLGRVGHRLASV